MHIVGLRYITVSQCALQQTKSPLQLLLHSSHYWLTCYWVSDCREVNSHIPVRTHNGDIRSTQKNLQFTWEKKRENWDQSTIGHLKHTTVSVTHTRTHTHASLLSSRHQIQLSCRVSVLYVSNFSNVFQNVLPELIPRHGTRITYPPIIHSAEYGKAKPLVVRTLLELGLNRGGNFSLSYKPYTQSMILIRVGDV
jgi:hypothetical protein